MQASALHGHIYVELALDPCAVVIAPNDAGKTTLLGLPSRVIDGAAETSDWSAELTFGDGRKAGRYSRHGSTWVTIGNERVKVREAKPLLASFAGRAAVWSLDSFLELSAAKRLEWLESNVFAGLSWPLERARDAVVAVADDEVAQLPAFVRAFHRPTPDGTPPSRRELRDDVDGRTALVELLRVARAAHLDADREAKALDRAVQVDEIDAAAQRARLPSGTTSTWRARIAELDAAINALHESYGTAMGAGAAYRAAAEHVERLAADVDRMNTSAVDEEAKLLEAVAAAAEAVAASPLLPGVGAESVRELEAAQAEAARLERLHGAALALVELEPHVAALERVIPPPHPAHPDLEALRAAIDAAKALRPDDVARARAIAAGIAAQHGAQRRAATARAERHHVAVSLHAQATQELERWRAAAGAREQAKADRLTELAAAQEALGTLEPVDVGVIEVQLEGLRTERAEAQRNADAHTDADAVRAQRDERRIRRDVAVALRTVYHATISAVSTVLATMLRELSIGLLESINRIVEPVLGEPIELMPDAGYELRLRHEVMRSATFRDVVSVPLETMSRSARAVVMAAIRVAIAERLGGWRVVVLDDLENLQPGRRTRLLEQLHVATADDRLDNVLAACVDNGDGWTPPAGVQLIRPTLGGFRGR